MKQSVAGTQVIALIFCLSLLFLFTCTKKQNSKFALIYKQFTGYLAEHVDSTSFVLNYSRILSINGKCSDWETWRFNIDSIDILVSKVGVITFKSLNRKSYSIITRTWTPALPDTHSSMGNSVSVPESLYSFRCKNSLSIDSVLFFFDLLRKRN